MKISTSFDIVRSDAEDMQWWINKYFREQADTNGDGNVDSSEALAWVTAKLEETFDTLLERAKTAREKEAPEELDAEYKAALAAKRAADAALEDFRKRR